jgi:amino acid adenylation domain-containing protein
VFAPLDPEVPAERLSYYLKDCDATLLLVDADTERLMQAGCPMLRVDSITADGAGFVSPEIGPDDPAYIIYTSGSTGQPKGVVANHRGFVNVLTSWNQTLRLVPSDRMAAVASISFDMAIVDFWAPLVAGATLVLFDRDTARDGELLSQAMAAQSVNVLQATPASWRMLVQAGWQGSANFRMVTGGEALARDLAENLLSRCAEVWNGYGPTETTVYSTLFRVEDAAAPILIGKPLANTQCHVLDAQLQALPPGVVGQLFIGGAGLAKGYHQRPELTAASFIEHPSLGRIYRTGDLVRLTADGLDYLGRNDFQVKVRGYRIELGEIEYALSRHPLVAEASVQVREKTTGDARIVTWVAHQPDGPAPTVNELRQSLRGFLPGYMIPAEFVVLPALPRLPNGKLNRAALPDPFGQARAAAQRRPPQTTNEQAIAAVWAKVLGLPLERIGLDDRFLELGGHSLLATQAAGQIRKGFNSQLALRTLMMDPLAVIAAQLPQAPEAAPLAEPKSAPVTSSAKAASSAELPNTSAPAGSEAAAKPKTSWWSKLLGDS